MLPVRNLTPKLLYRDRTRMLMRLKDKTRLLEDTPRDRDHRDRRPCTARSRTLDQQPVFEVLRRRWRILSRTTASPPCRVRTSSGLGINLPSIRRRSFDRPQIVVATRRGRLSRPDTRDCRARSISHSCLGSDRRQMQMLHERDDFDVASHHLLTVI